MSATPDSGKPAATPVTFIDDPHAPEFFVSGCAGLAPDGPNWHLSFVSARVNHSTNPGQPARVVNLRVVMSDPILQALTQFLVQALVTHHAAQENPDAPKH